MVVAAVPDRFGTERGLDIADFDHGRHGPFAGERHGHLEARERVATVTGRPLDEELERGVVDLGALGLQAACAGAW